MSTLNPNQTLLQGAHQSPSDKTPAPLTPSNSLVSFAFHGVQPPSLLYVDVDDQLIVQAASSQTAEVVTVNVRLLLPNGRIEDMQFIVRPTSTRTVLRQSFGLAQGYILSASAVAAVAVTRGQTFLRIATQRSASGTGNPAQMLFADYVTTQATSAYPNGRVLSPNEGPGWITPFVVANPAAGADWLQAVPTNARWRVRGWNATFTTSVVVANRQIKAVVSGLGSFVWDSCAVVNAVASGTYIVSAGGITPYACIDPLTIVLGLPPDLVITSTSLAAQNILTLTSGIQVADQWGAIKLLVEEWLDNV